jgi:acetolactate synthase-1/2/3 large subunit
MQRAPADPAGALLFSRESSVERRRSGADLVVDVLEEEGVETAFGYPGGSIMPLYDALYEHRVQHVLVRHEAAAAFAASAYARTTGRVGVCIATSGPGATNLVTGIADAMLDNVPMVAITGQVKSHLMGTDAFQEIDIASITHAVTKRNVVVRSIDELVPALRRAFQLARGPRPGPVLVDIPSDVLREIHTGDVTAKQPRERALYPQADPGAIAATVEAILRAKRPVAIVGGGARWSGATSQYREFASLLGAPHTSTIHGLGCADPDDASFLGMLGMHGWTAANRAVAQADVILALGMRFDDRVTGDPKTFAPQAHTIVHADIDVSEFGKIVTPQIKLHGDLKETLQALSDALRATTVPSFSTWREQAAALGGPLPRDPSPNGLLATDVLDAFFAVLPRNAIVTTDVGQHQMWAAQRARPCDPDAFLTSGGLGSMGFGLPAAIGAAIAHPGRPVFAIVGDGGFQMSLPELATLRRYDLPVKILLVDNRNLGMVRQWQQLFYEGRYSATSLWDNPDFCALAAAYGVRSIRLAEGDSLAHAMEHFVSAPGAMLMHAECFPHENVFPMIPSGTSVEHLIEAIPT